MKKNTKLLALALSAAMFSGCVGTASAKEVTVKIDGKPLESSVPAQVVNGSSLMPVRDFLDAIGVFLKWDSDTNTVLARKGSKTVSLTIDSDEMVIDKGKTDESGNPITETEKLNTPAQLISDKTMVPIRAISEAFGYNVSWNEDTLTADITSEDEDDSWKKNKGEIDLTTLSVSGSGVNVSGNTITITKGGDFKISGESSDANIVINCEERVKLRLSGVKLTSAGAPCIYAENTDKLFIETENKNTLTSKNSDDGTVYSKENLEFKGDGEITIISDTGNGVKASDNLNIESGTVNVISSKNGVSVNDTFKMTGGTLDVTAKEDGITCDSIVAVYDGNINIKTTGEPVEVSGETEFEASAKGIKADWLLTIDGGVISVKSTDTAIHSADELNINGGSITLYSEYEKGISSHGELTINGEDTEINIEKSTEGIEGKELLTINDGNFIINSTDDGLNGGVSTMPDFGGEMPFRGEENTDEAERPEQHGNRFAPPETGENMPVPPENGGKMPRPDDMKEFTPPDGTENNRMRPGRGKNMPGQGGDFIPPDMSEMGENIPGQGGDFAPPEMGGNRPGHSQKDVVIINGGNFEITCGDDGIDSNGNLLINGGTVKVIKSNGEISGANACLDADGRITISENADLIAVARSGSLMNINTDSNSILINTENTKESGSEIIIKSSNGDVLISYTPKSDFSAVYYASAKLETGSEYKVLVGDEAFDITITDKITKEGTTTSAQMQRGRGFWRNTAE